jgi:hypothetical protein
MQPHNEPTHAPSITGTRGAAEAPHGAAEGREEASGWSADDAAIQILSEQGAQCGDCGDQPGDRICPDCERCRRWYVAALRKAGWAPRSEVLSEVYAAIEDPAQRKAVGGGLGWETARDVVHNLLRKTVTK